MKLSFNRILMSVMFAIMPVFILLNTLLLEINFLSVLLTIVIVTGLICALQIKNKYVKIGVIAVAIILFILTNSIESLQYGLKELTDRYSQFMGQYKNKITDKIETEEAEYIVCLIRLYLEIMIPCLFVVYKNRLWKMVYIDVTIPFIILCLAIGLAPSVFEVYVMTFLYVNLAVSDTESKKHINLTGDKGKIIKEIYVNILLFIIFGLVILSNVIKPYERSEKFDEMKVEINAYLDGEKSFSFDKLFDNVFDFLSAETGHGGMSNGQLGTVDEIEFSGDEIMEITLLDGDFIASNFPIYIKSFVGTVYTGNSWENSNEAMDDEVNELAENFDISLTQVDEITVDFLSHSDMYIMMNSTPKQLTYKIELKDEDDTNNYWPAYSYTDMESEHDGQREETDGDYGVKKFTSFTGFRLPSSQNIRSITYEYGAYPGKEYVYYASDEVELLNSRVNIAEYYEKLAKKNYLEIPDSFMGIAEEIRNSYVTSESEKYHIGSNGANISELGYTPFIKFVQDYLGERCTYSLSPGKLNSGEDFVDKFLNETHEGYCSHFASAGVLMFRAMGIPARYVEGYCISRSLWDGESETITVKDDSAHAWVEIFVDGIGWYTVDVTPSGYRSIIEEKLTEDNDNPVENKTTENKNTEKTTTKEANTTKKITTTENQTTKKPAETTKNEKTTSNTGATFNTDVETTGEGGIGEGTGEEGGAGTESSFWKNFGVIMQKLGIIALIVIIIGIALMLIRVRSLKKQNRYRELIKSERYSVILKTFTKQLQIVMKMKGIRLIYFENTKQIAGNILQAYEELGYDKAERTAETLIKYKFSNEPITKGDADIIVDTVKKINRYVYDNANFITKLRMYYIKCLYLSKK
ncbi:MAG: hypothetical protein IIX45_08680 [Lachnospiraceae bacterium]|nr:hypothetical protein [Lachnospiraceae bacterium]